MIRSFWYHEFGFGFKITEEQLKQRNKFCEGKKDIDKEAAIVARQSINKGPLTINLFIQEFEYGKSSEGYWTYFWICQLEDCIECSQDLFKDQYQSLFVFDYSCGLDKKDKMD